MFRPLGKDLLVHPLFIRMAEPEEEDPPLPRWVSEDSEVFVMAVLVLGESCTWRYKPWPVGTFPFEVVTESTVLLK